VHQSKNPLYIEGMIRLPAGVCHLIVFQIYEQHTPKSRLDRGNFFAFHLDSASTKVSEKYDTDERSSFYFTLQNSQQFY